MIYIYAPTTKIKEKGKTEYNKNEKKKVGAEHDDDE
jgi:hypothetical protein